MNSDLIKDAEADEGVKLVNVPLMEMAKEAGSPVVTNVVMFGLLCAYTQDIDLEVAKKARCSKMAHKEKFIPINTKSL